MTRQFQQSAALSQEVFISLASTDVAQLRHFHQTHFSGQEAPELSSTNHTEGEQHDDDDGLGYYVDGVKRTLTDEQVKMFRHSEIQRLLSERRQAESRKIEDQRRQRRQEKRATRPPRFDDEPGQHQDNVSILMYDDEVATEQEQNPATDKKFLWPTLGK